MPINTEAEVRDQWWGGRGIMGRGAVGLGFPHLSHVKAGRRTECLEKIRPDWAQDPASKGRETRLLFLRLRALGHTLGNHSQ